MGIADVVVGIAAVETTVAATVAESVKIEEQSGLAESHFAPPTANTPQQLAQQNQNYVQE